MTPIAVVAAIVERDGCFLLTLRPDGTHMAGHWEFPGGKVHGSETHAGSENPSYVDPGGR